MMGRLLLLLCALLIVGYGVFEARKLLEGPVITIDLPLDGSATSSAVTVEGEAQNIAFLTIEDRPAYTDISGQFDELLSLPPGVSILTVAAVDRFGRRVSKSVSINVIDYCPVTA